VFIAVFIVIVAIQYLLPKPVNWSRTYLQKGKSPFGCYAIYNLMNGVYSERTMLNNQTLYNLKNRVTDSTSLLIINDKINFNKSDIRSLYDLLEKGATVFIAATRFDGALADTFHIRTQFSFFNYFTNVDSLINKPGESITLTSKKYAKKPFVYSQVANIAYFKNFDSTQFKVHAILPQKQACLLSTQVGKGKLYLMSVPDVFGNYYIVNHENREIPYYFLSMIKNKDLIWDEHYKTFNVQRESIIKFILESDALYTAYLLLFFTILIYMIFEGRRRQRPIVVSEPVTNSTLEFVNVITHVYYNSKSHQNIATEKIKYFYENVRKKFNVNTNEIDDLLLSEISELSGIELKKVKQLFNYCERLKTSTEISEYDLVELNRQISNFNKNSLR
jgi:hypothetical protein